MASLGVRVRLQITQELLAELETLCAGAGNLGQRQACMLDELQRRYPNSDRNQNYLALQTAVRIRRTAAEAKAEGEVHEEALVPAGGMPKWLPWVAGGVLAVGVLWFFTRRR